MDALAGPYLASAALLVLAGASKLVDPLSLTRALRLAGLPVRFLHVRLLAAVELGVGVLALASGSRLAAVLVALSYTGFTAFVLHVLRRGGALASCGCFGKADTPPTRTHVAVTGALAAMAAMVAVRPLGPLPDLLDRQAGAGIPLVMATLATGAMAYLALTALPLLRGAR